MENICSLLFSLSLLVVSSATGFNGVDLSVETSVETWKCFEENDVDFAIVRTYRSNGKVDDNSVDSLKHARRVGIKNLHAYMFPCITTSNVNQGNKVTCDSATKQFQDTMDLLESNGFTVRRNKNSANSDISGPVVERIWIDIEDESNPSKYFDDDPSINLAFMDELVMEATSQGVSLGVYTTPTYWKQIMDDTSSYGNSDGILLWYPKWDATNNMDFFVPFGGWDFCSVKQTAGNAPLCNVSQVDLDYMHVPFGAKGGVGSGTCSCQQYGGGTCSGFCSGGTCPCMNCQRMTQTC